MINLPLGCICGGWIEASLILMGCGFVARFFKKKEKHNHCTHDKDPNHCHEHKDSTLD
jgi:hypothetical protein